MKIAHLCLVSADLDATRKFYCDGLGLRKAFDFRRGDDIIGFYLEVGSGNFIEIFRRDAVPVEQVSPFQHFCLEVDSIDDLSARLTRLDIAITPKKMGADHSWQAWLTDPSGVKIELHEYTPESSQRTGADCIVTW